MQKIIIDYKGQDRIELEFQPKQNDENSVSTVQPRVKLKAFGCSELLELLQQMNQKFGADLLKWPQPTGKTHQEIILRETLLKAKGEWKSPYSEAELCHCRGIATELVEQAIVNGAHTPEAVSLSTSAGTACGTCRPNIESLINYRLK